MSNPFTDIIISTATPSRPARLVSTREINNDEDDLAHTISKLNTKLRELGMNVDEQKSSISPLVINNELGAGRSTYTSRPLPSLPRRALSTSTRYRLSLGEEANTVRSRFASDEIDQVLEFVEGIKRIIGDFDASVILNKIGYYDHGFVEVRPQDGDEVSDISSISGSRYPSNHAANDQGDDRLIPSEIETPLNEQLCSSSKPHPGQRFLSRIATQPGRVHNHNSEADPQEHEGQSSKNDGGNSSIPRNFVITQAPIGEEISRLSLKSPLTLETEDMDDDPIHPPHGSLSPPASKCILQRQPFGNTITSLPAGNLNLTSTLTDSAHFLHQTSISGGLSDTIGSNRLSQRYSAGLNMRAVSIKLSANGLQGLLNNTISATEPLSPRELFPAMQRESSIHAMRLMTPSKHGQFFQLQQSQVLSTSSLDKNQLSLTLDSSMLLNNSNHGDPSTASRQLFAEFNVIGIHPSVIQCETSLSDSITQSCEVLYTLPALQDEKSLIVENLHEYIFPKGAQLSIVPSSEYKRLRNQPSILKILQFTDSANRILYGYTLVVHEKVLKPSKELIEKLLRIEELKIAAGIILQFFRRQQYRKIKLKTIEIQGKFLSNGRASLDGDQSVYSDTGADDKFSIQETNSKRPKSRIRTLVSSALKPIKDTFIGKKTTSTKRNVPLTGPVIKAIDGSVKNNRGRAQSVSAGQPIVEDGKINSIQFVQDGPVGLKKKRSNSDCSGVTQARSLLFSSSDDNSTDGNSWPVSKDAPKHDQFNSTPPQTYDRTRSNDSAISSVLTDSCHQDQQPQNRIRHVEAAPRMLLKFRESVKQIKDRTVIQQKAYCILSESPLPVLFYKMLQVIVDLEQTVDQEENENSENDNQSPSGLSNFGDTLGTPLRSKFQLRQSSAVIKFLSSMRRQDSNKLIRKLKISDVDFPCAPPLKISAESPSLADWTVGVLFSFLPVEVILHIHSLLLIEKSLVILGRDESMISIVATAFVNLLLPLKWAGIFVPLLPPLALEVLDAPVPYIVGVNLAGVFNSFSTKRPKLPISPSAAILYIDDFLEHPRAYQMKQQQQRERDKDEIVANPLDTYPSSLPTMSSIGQNVSPVPYSLGEKGPFKSFWNCEKNFSDRLFFETPTQLDMDLADIFPPTTITSPVTRIESTASVLKNLFFELTFLARYFKLDCESSYQKKILEKNKKYNSDSIKCDSNKKVSRISLETFVNCALIDFDYLIYKPIRKILKLFHDYNDRYTGRVLSSSFAWQDICHEDPHSHALVVNAEKVLEPWKQHTCIQEHIMQTQMFALMLDGQCSLLQQHHKRKFICDWFAFQIHKKRKRKK